MCNHREGLLRKKYKYSPHCHDTLVYVEEAFYSAVVTYDE